MPHRDPLLAIREKLDARARDLEEVEYDLAEAHEELARHKVRVEELESHRLRIAVPATSAPRASRTWRVVAVLFALALFASSAVVVVGTVLYFALRPMAPVASPPAIVMHPVMQPIAPTAEPRLVLPQGDGEPSVVRPDGDYEVPDSINPWSGHSEPRPAPAPAHEVLDPWR